MPPASARDDAESAPVTALVVEKGGVGSSDVPPKGAEPPTQSTNSELLVHKRKLPAQAGLERRDALEFPQPETLEVWFCF